jgi:hypothetical protein
MYNYIVIVYNSQAIDQTVEETISFIGRDIDKVEKEATEKFLEQCEVYDDLWDEHDDEIIDEIIDARFHQCGDYTVELIAPEIVIC